MIKECLIKLIETKIDIGDKKKTSIQNYLNRYEEDILLNIMATPIGLVADDVNIHFFPNVGFRCSNDIQKYGRLPICNIIQRILNEEYMKLKDNDRITENNNINSQMYYMLEKLKNLK